MKILSKKEKAKEIEAIERDKVRTNESERLPAKEKKDVCKDSKHNENDDIERQIRGQSRRKNVYLKI